MCAGRGGGDPGPLGPMLDAPLFNMSYLSSYYRVLCLLQELHLSTPQVHSLDNY